jgi:hypothetical protein
MMSSTMPSAKYSCAQDRRSYFGKAGQRPTTYLVARSLSGLPMEATGPIWLQLRLLEASGQSWRRCCQDRRDAHVRLRQIRRGLLTAAWPTVELA